MDENNEYFFSELSLKLHEINDIFLDCEFPNFIDEDNEYILGDLPANIKECLDLLKIISDIVKRST